MKRRILVFTTATIMTAYLTVGNVFAQTVPVGSAPVITAIEVMVISEGNTDIEDNTIRERLHDIGKIESVNGNSLTVILGGAEEQMAHSEGHERAVPEKQEGKAAEKPEKKAEAAESGRAEIRRIEAHLEFDGDEIEFSLDNSVKLITYKDGVQMDIGAESLKAGDIVRILYDSEGQSVEEVHVISQSTE